MLIVDKLSFKVKTSYDLFEYRIKQLHDFLKEGSREILEINDMFFHAKKTHTERDIILSYSDSTYLWDIVIKHAYEEIDFISLLGYQYFS